VARPIMYYRPASPGGDVHLRITLHPGANFKRAAGACCSCSLQPVAQRFCWIRLQPASAVLAAHVWCLIALSDRA
jgi:hypothetical protein